jgi:bacterioferritin-associated ferredoxin
LFVCICNALNDRTVSDILANGGGAVDTPAAIHRAAGCKPQCGRCLPDMADMIRESQCANSFVRAAARAAD